MPASLNFKDSANASIVNANIKTIVYEDSAGNKYTFGVDNTNVFNTFKYQPNGALAEIDYSATAKNFMTQGAIAALLGIGTNVGEIKTKTDFIPDTFTADVTAIKDATNAANLGNKLGEIKAKTDKITDTLGADVTAIKAKTDKMPANLSADLTTITTETDKIAAIGTNVDEIKTKTDTIPDDLGADVTAIKAKTDTIPANLTAKVTAIETATNAANLGTKLDGIKTKTDKMPADLSAELIKLATIGNAINGNGNVTEAAKAVLESSFKQAITDAGKDGSEWLEDTVKKIVSQPYFDIPADESAPISAVW